MTPAVRIGDLDLVHCSLPVRAVGSPNVSVNGLPWALVPNINIPHLIPAGKKCVVHTAPILSGSTTVFVNGLSAGKVGAPLLTCTATATGSPNVLVGG